MQSLGRLTLFLCCLWTASLLYGEMLAYRVPFWSCSWPLLHSHQQQSPSTSSSNTSSFYSWTKNQLPYPKDQVNIAVLADPQLMDRTSLGLTPKSFALETVQFYTDIYMKRSFLSSILPFKPNLLLFLGDQFDGGPFLDDAEWEESLYRFRHIFDVNRRKENIKSYYLSGNHDIGYAGFHSQNDKVINRYEEAFGARDYRFTVHGVDFIVIDAQTLDGAAEGRFTLKSWDFIRSISKENTSNPRILLTHIPLYRPDETPCGSFRSSPIINQRISYTGIGRGIRYQNYLSAETSRHLLDAIKPVLVLSGHDHDQCTVSHSTSYGNVTEHTLGTVSWQQGNLYPSFMLLSVANPTTANSTSQAQEVSTHLCFLPNQTFIYIWYIVLFVITLLLLTFWPTHGLDWGSCGRWYSDFISSIRTTTKEKDEDEEGEYEMVWDAEGSMHLVKKASPSISHKTSMIMGLTGRGSVTARPQARKSTVQDATSSVTIEVNAAEAFGRIRGSSSNVVKLVQRLFRVLRLLSLIAVVNLPLYMMMLFKDWVDR